MSEDSFELKPIAYIQSCYKQKFGIPRQPGLVKQATAQLVFEPDYSLADSIRGIEQFSHLWIIFLFHKSISRRNKITVRPPRLGGKVKLGVFATRSNFRPNPIGQSVVQFVGVEIKNGRCALNLTGGDFLDGTPVLDIKPYIPYADSVPNARAGFASEPPVKKYQVIFSQDSLAEIDQASRILPIDLKKLIAELLSYDPRPAHYDGKNLKKEFSTTIFDGDLKWRVDGNIVKVLAYSAM